MDEMSRKELFFNKIAIYFCAAIAIFFFVAGIYELRVNAADDYAVNVQYITHGYDGGGNEIDTRATDLGSIVSTTPIDAYFYTPYDKPVATTHKYTVFLVSEQPMTDNDVQTTLNGTTVYICMFGPVSAGLYYDGGGYLEPFISGNRYSYDLNTDYSDISAFSSALSSNTLDCEQIIDYSKFEIDDNMPYPTDFSVNKIYNSTNTDKFVYDYITWTNTNKEYSIQVDIGPVVYTYENKLFGFKYGKLLAYHDSNYLLEEILEPLTHQFTFEVFDPDDYYPQKDYIPSFMAYYKKIDAEYPAGTFTDYNNFNSVGYRFRYIDKSNLKAGPYVIVVPDRRNLGSYESYVLYSDGYFSSGEDSTGIYNKYENGNLDDMVADVDKEVIYKDKYETIDGDMDVTEATGWLKSVASFIKGTPDFVGSVMSFLPDPIRYGMYVCLFLGVIASGYAIVKALI